MFNKDCVTNKCTNRIFLYMVQQITIMQSDTKNNKQKKIHKNVAVNVNKKNKKMLLINIDKRNKKKLTLTKIIR